jgi:chorismate mutase/prephenate dehydratase
LSGKFTINELRKQIDKIDARVVGLLNERARLVIEIGKKKEKKEKNFYVPSREEEIYQNASRANCGPLSEKAIHGIFREILSASRSLEASLRIAYFGPEATFTHMAARSKFGSQAEFIPAETIPQVFEEVARNGADYGVVPVENSTEGVVTHTLDMFVDSDLKICAEISLGVHLYLLSKTGKKEDIRRVISHPQPIAQCRNWLASALPNVRIQEVASTAKAAQLARSYPDAAAIASELAREFYDLKTVANRIEDSSTNITRFLVIGNSQGKRTGEDKTSVLFSVKDEVGILQRMLAPFARNRVNLTKIESRPVKTRPWEYVFFLDMNGHQRDPKVDRALKELRRRCDFLKVLGSYPAAT